MATHKAFNFLKILLVLPLALTIAACARQEGRERVVATINDYEMTIEDFNYESKEIFNIGKMLGEMPATKEDILDALIIKEVLLQEAQAQNLDKDKDFMKTIELYWEQTLLKNLLTKKSEEIQKKIMVYDNEVADYYNKMKTKIKAKVFIFADEKSARKLAGYRDVAAYVGETPGLNSLMHAINSRWYTLGRDAGAMEECIFNVGAKERDVAKIDGNWALIIIEEKAPNEIEPLPALKDEIARYIRQGKEKAFLDEWIDGLRSKARIKINSTVLKELR